MPQETRDVQIATYIRFKGNKSIDTYLDDADRGVFVFDLTEEQMKQLSIDYSNSEHAPFEGVRRGFLKQLDMLKKSRESNRGGKSHRSRED